MSDELQREVKQYTPLLRGLANTEASVQRKKKLLASRRGLKFLSDVLPKILIAYKETAAAAFEGEEEEGDFDDND